MEISNQTMENLFDNAIVMEQLESRFELAAGPEPSDGVKPPFEIIICDL
jgi:hypothetical protein